MYDVWQVCQDCGHQQLEHDLSPKPKKERDDSRMKVITLCGSTRFKKQFEEQNALLTLDGNVVISVGVFGHADEVILLSTDKEKLDEIHKIKIKMADEIFVINPGGYIGKSTASEINYAKQLGKPVSYLVAPTAVHLEMVYIHDIKATIVGSMTLDEHERVQEKINNHTISMRENCIHDGPLRLIRYDMLKNAETECAICGEDVYIKVEPLGAGQTWALPESKYDLTIDERVWKN